MRAATSVDVSGDFQNYEHGENGTTVEYIVEFHWNGIASNWFNDIFAITWNSPLNETDSDGYVNYKSVSGFVSEVKHNPRVYMRQPLSSRSICTITNTERRLMSMRVLL